MFLVQLFLGTFKCPASSLLFKRFSVHRVGCCEILYHQPMFHPISSLVSSVGCVLVLFLAVSRVLLNCSVHFSRRGGPHIPSG